MGATSDKIPLVMIAGPTAVGKSDVAVRLALALSGEVVSADSMQVYRGMDIGTAKMTAEEMQGVPHHLIDCVDPREDFDVLRFQQMALEAIDGIRQRGHLPILAGGTGFYMQAIRYRIPFTKDAADPAIRQELEELAASRGAEYLHELLAEADPEYAAAIPAGNVKRVVRALEYFRTTGEPISEHNRKMRERESAWNDVCAVLYDDREVLYERINARVDTMIEKGLVREVERLREQGCTRHMVSMQGIGYKEIFAYLEHECTLEEAIDAIKSDSRHFAKRQMTWYRREKDILWVPAGSKQPVEEVTGFLIRHIREHILNAGQETR